jgi:anaerobic selenocysteine-containing dehydrogenase
MEKLTVTRRTFLKAAAVTGAAAAAFSPGMGPLKGLARAEKRAVAQADVQVVKSACKACIHNCGVLVHVRDGRVIKIEGNPEDPMNRGALCAKGMAGIQALYHPNRMKYPFKRVGQRGEGKWQRISWDEALEIIAKQLIETKQKYGAETVFYTYGGGGSPGGGSEAQRKFLNVYGSPNGFEPGQAQCHTPRDEGYRFTLGYSEQYSIADSRCQELYFPEDNQSKCLVIWGTTPAYHAPAGSGRCLAELRARGVQTINIDPRLTPDAAKADIWLPIRPGTDTALMLAWMKYIMDEGLDDKEFLIKWSNAPFLVDVDTKLFLRESDVTAGGSADVYMVWDEKTGSAKAWPFPWDEQVQPALYATGTVGDKDCKTAYQLLKERVDEYTIEKAAEICWLPADKIRAAVDMYATNRPSSIILGLPIEHNITAWPASRAGVMLDVMLGNIEIPGVVAQRFKSLPRTGGSGGTFKSWLPPEQQLKRLGVAEHKMILSREACHPPTLFNAILTGKPYKPRVWLERSGNKLATLGNVNMVYEAIKQLDFIVHMYMYPTSFSTYADILLPATEWLETNYPVAECNVLFARQAVVRLWENRDQIMAWPALAWKMAELGDADFIKACDPNAMSGSDWAFASSEEELLDKMVGSLKLTWNEFKEKAPITPIPLEEWRDYQVYAKIDPDTGKPKGFPTATQKCEIYSEDTIIVGRTGIPQAASLKSRYSPIPLPPASKDYDPLPYYLEPSESPYSTPDIANEYPLIFTSGRVPFYHHATLRNIPYLRELYPVPEMWINPITAEGLGITSGNWVWIESLRGKTRAKALVTEGILPGVVYMERFWFPELPEADPSAYGWREMNVNVLTKTDPPYNPEVGTYTLRAFQVKVYKAPEGAPEGVWQKPEEFAAWLPQPPGEV